MMTAERHDRLIDRMSYDPFSEFLGVRYEVAGEGRIISRIKIEPRHLNPFGTVHGGLIYVIADTGMGQALASVLGAEARCATISVAVQYLEAPVTEELTAESVIIHRGAKMATVRGEIRNAEGSLCAIATSTFYISASAEES